MSVFVHGKMSNKRLSDYCLQFRDSPYLRVNTSNVVVLSSSVPITSSLVLESSPAWSPSCCENSKEIV